MPAGKLPYKNLSFQRLHSHRSSQQSGLHCQRSSKEILFTLFFAEEYAFFWLLWASERCWPAVWSQRLLTKTICLRASLRSTILKLNFESQGTSSGNPRSDFVIPKPRIQHSIGVTWWDSSWSVSSKLHNRDCPGKILMSICAATNQNNYTCSDLLKHFWNTSIWTATFLYSQSTTSVQRDLKIFDLCFL